MQVTEQIDALEVMGVRSISHLVLPKLLAALLIFPFLVVIAMVLGMGAGAWICNAAELSSFADYEYGIQIDFQAFDVAYALIKACIFALIITSVSAYHGHHTSGGAREVGRSSTTAVVYSVVIVMIANLVITCLLYTSPSPRDATLSRMPSSA